MLRNNDQALKLLDELKQDFFNDKSENFKSANWDNFITILPTIKIDGEGYYNVLENEIRNLITYLSKSNSHVNELGVLLNALQQGAVDNFSKLFSEPFPKYSPPSLQSMGGISSNLVGKIFETNEKCNEVFREIVSKCYQDRSKLLESIELESLLNSLKKPENLIFLIDEMKLDFSKINIDFLLKSKNELSEDILMTLITKYPDHFIYNNPSASALLNFCFEKNYLKAIEEFGKSNQSLQINQKSIGSVEAAKLIQKYPSITGANLQNNIHYASTNLELATEYVSNFFQTKQSIPGGSLSAESKSIIKAMLEDDRAVLFSQRDVENIMKFAQKHDAWDVIPNDYMLKSSLKNDLRMYIFPSLSFLGNEKLFEKFLPVIEANKNNDDFKKPLSSLAKIVYNPRIACDLIKSGFSSKDFQWDILVNAAKAQKDNTSAEFLIQEARKYNVTPSIVDISTKENQFNEFETDRLNMISYTTNSTQANYRQQQKAAADLINISIALGKFEILPKDFTQEAWQALNFSSKSRVAMNYPGSFSLLNLGNIRNAIAIVSTGDSRSNFGYLRNGHGNPSTPFTAYKTYYHKVLDGALKDPQAFDIQGYEYDIDEGRSCPTIQIHGKINGVDIPLTRMAVSEGRYQWIHTGGEYLPKILAHCQKLYDQLPQNPIDSNNEALVADLLKKVGELHWWLSHAMPFERGSASVSEMICMGICNRHGLDVSWNTLLDCEALICPSVEKYKNNYMTQMIQVNNKNFDFEKYKEYETPISHEVDHGREDSPGMSVDDDRKNALKLHQVIVGLSHEYYNTGDKKHAKDFVELIAKLNKIVEPAIGDDRFKKSVNVINEALQKEFDRETKGKLLFKGMTPDQFVKQINNQTKDHHYIRALANVVKAVGNHGEDNPKINALVEVSKKINPPNKGSTYIASAEQLGKDLEKEKPSVEKMTRSSYNH